MNTETTTVINIKKLSVTNLSKKVTEEDIRNLFVLNTTFLNTHSTVEIIENENGASCYINVPEQVYIECLKMNGSTFYDKELEIQDTGHSEQKTICCDESGDMPEKIRFVEKLQFFKDKKNRHPL